MSSTLKKAIIPIFVPHKGCPHDCVFCNQDKITGYKEDINKALVKERIEMYLSTMTDRQPEHIEIAFYGGSFTAIDFSIQKTFLEVAHAFVVSGQVHSIRLSTRPDAISIEGLKLLKKHGVQTIELGVQSMDIDVLKGSERGHLVEDVVNATELIKREGFRLGLQMMIGLPEDTEAKNKATALQIADLKPDFVRIYPTLVIRNTKLAELYKSGEYQPLTLNEAIKWTAIAYTVFGQRSIPVIRVGLQPTTELEDGTTVVAGPYHPSFRQMVDGYVFQTCIDTYLKSLSKSFKALELTIHPKMRSALMGIRKQVINEIIEKNKIEDLKIMEDKDMNIDDINVKVNGFESELLNRFETLNFKL